MLHEPVLLEEVLSFLNISEGGVYADCTVGTGGHSEGILNRAGSVRVIGIDCDESAVEISRERLRIFGDRFVAVCDNFLNLDFILERLGIPSVNGVLLDLGLSSLQLSGAGRGFSFMADDELDMRFGAENELTAGKIVNELPEKELIRIFREFGEEPAARKVARAIAIERKKEPIVTTGRLAGIVKRVCRRGGRMHPATRVFQALRIAVNNELEVLEKFMEKVFPLISVGGRLCVISYHSLEDRIVKWSLKSFQAVEGGALRVEVLTPKPVVPGREEICRNRRSRSAKLRAAARAG